jgi:hypothetical protein
VVERQAGFFAQSSRDIDGSRIVTADVSNFVVGVCTRLRDSSAFIDVRAQSVEGEMHDLSSSSQNLFPPDGEVELRGGRSLIRVGDWAIARPVLEGPPGRRHYVANASRRLLPFEDLLALGAEETARRMLVETGRSDGFEGDKAFRIGTDREVVVTMRRTQDGRSRAHSVDMKRLPVFPFDDRRLHTVPTGAGFVQFFEAYPVSQQIGVLNWSTDMEFVSDLIRAATDLQNGPDVPNGVAQLLLADAARLERQLKVGSELDSKTGNEIIRSRQLAELLIANNELVQQFISALRSEPAIKSRIDAEVQTLAAAEISARREQIAADLGRELEEEFAAVRASRRSELDATLMELEASMLSDLERKMATAETGAFSNLEVRRLGLERAVAGLEKARDDLDADRLKRSEEVESLETRKAHLDAEIDERKADIDRLLKIHTLIEGERPQQPSHGSFWPSVSKISDAAPPLALESVEEWIKNCPLLTDRGRSELGRFSAYLLAGGIPVLTGPEVEDFLDVAARMISGGSLVALDCDPTIITFEDLWTRPGAGPTALGMAYAETETNGPARLCVILRADLSPAEYWIDPLALKSRRGELPKSLFVCVTVSDARSENAERVLAGRMAFSTVGTIDRNAAVKVVALTGAGSIDRRLVLPESDETAGAELVLAMQQVDGPPVRIGDVKWLARLAGLSKRILGSGAQGFVQEAVRSARASGADAETKQPDLKVIDARGPSHA